MVTLEDLQKRVAALEIEVYEAKMYAAAAYTNLKASSTALGYKMDLLNPSTLNSKLEWLHFNYWDNSPVRYYINDKYLFKYFQATILGTEKYYIPLYGVYDSAETIDFDELPENFVLKRTLGGAASEVKLVNKTTDNLNDIRSLARKWMANTGNGKARLIAEKTLEFDEDYIVDYKVYVANGKATHFMCGVMKKTGGHRSYVFYDLNWNRFDLRVSKNTIDIPKPKNLEQMIALAEEVGTLFPFIRVDLYSSLGKLYIGELTGLPFNCVGPYEKFDAIWGRTLTLPTQEEIAENFTHFYHLFPELTLDPIFLKGKNPRYRVVRPNAPANAPLPTPPKFFIQPK